MTSQLPCFQCLFLSCQQQKNPTKNRAAVTSLRSFLFLDNFSKNIFLFKELKERHIFLLLHDSIQGSKIILKPFATILSNNPITFIHKTRSIFARVALVVVIESHKLKMACS